MWRYSRAARGYLLVTVAAGAVTAGMVIVSALMIGTVLAGVITDPATRTVDAWRWEIAVLAGAVLVRTAASWARSRYSHRAALRVVGDVRAHVLAAAVDAEPRALASRREDLATVVTRGLDALRPYLTGYLPALGLAITVTPAALAVIAWQDLTSAVIIAVTLPLVPIFMILIGLLTRGASQRRLRTMSVLSAQLLDLIAGLPTLRALGRQRGPEARVRKLGEDHRIAAMATLRWAFLSSMVLELLATLCVALVAVSIGLRLVYGDMSLSAGLIALVLAPEVYAPLRAVGVQFHAAEDGVAASDSAFRACEELRDRATPAQTPPPPPPPLPGAGGASQALARPVTVRLDGVSVRGRSNLAPCGLDAEFRPGRITALAGANGAGKTTALHAILGLQVPDE
ncbi:MAG: thiol reductant ABC exporter subunit CydD, partial [Tomitella sp.]|nr:thiol reductant ABC exporter subunit CydD [Tomitella sp.]